MLPEVQLQIKIFLRKSQFLRKNTNKDFLLQRDWQNFKISAILQDFTQLKEGHSKIVRYCGVFAKLKFKIAGFYCTAIEKFTYDTISTLHLDFVLHNTRLNYIQIHDRKFYLFFDNSLAIPWQFLGNSLAIPLCKICHLMQYFLTASIYAQVS